ncbi:hypothetical protein [Qipengyuania sp. ASV99]|uniref:hypothetical protein n=1 Tax=Qipengyuania sp. ASV99 TaxID=3399681 RepID=UPI003A4C5F3A
MAGSDSDITKIWLEAAKRQQERIEAEAVDFEFPDWTQVSAETYATAVAPKEALDRFPFDTDLAITQLQRELQYDRVQAVCHEAMIFDEGKGFRLPYALLHNWHWWQQMPRSDNDFWTTGYLEIAVPKKIGGMSFEARGRIRYFGVRFWPDGLPGGVDNPVASGNDNSSDASLPPLPTAEAERVAKALLDHWGKTLTEKRAVELARGMCPENRVSRDGFLETFRAIRGPKMPGKQPSTGK